MKHIAAVILLVLIGCTHTTTWVPPTNPNPQAILNEAEQDSRAGRYEVALAKFVWFHENALTIEPSLSGVRLSFALSDWYDLAQKYPPALDAMRQARGQAAANVLAGREPRRAFQEVAAIDQSLGQEAMTGELFETLDRDQPDVAKSVFDIAKRALVEQKAFELANKYVDPPADITRLVQRYREDLQMAPEPGDPDYSQIARKSFTYNASILVATLAANGRLDEATMVADTARGEIQDAEFEQSMVAALRGVAPEPWP